MEYTLHNLPKGSARKKKRLGRGKGSGKGTFSARGLKGQRARSGGRQGLARRAAFHQLLIRTPKLRGFKRASVTVPVVNLSDLEKAFEAGEKVTAQALVAKRLIRSARAGFKVLGHGTLTKALTIRASAYSNAARQAIEKAGGTCETV